jgi:hypothetical protein
VQVLASSLGEVEDGKEVEDKEDTDTRDLRLKLVESQVPQPVCLRERDRQTDRRGVRERRERGRARKRDVYREDRRRKAERQRGQTERERQKGK